MKTEASEYLSLLQEIQNNNVSTFTVMPADEPRFTIETNSRNIIVPSEFSFLSVQNDHRAETIYFEIDRYFDNVDLSQHACVVQFINKSGTTINEGTYPVTSMDIDSVDGKIVFGWEIRNDATQLTGDITFSVRFYSIDNNGNFTYNFNTLTASSYILPSLNIIASGERITATELEVWTDKMNNLASSIESDIITVEEKIEEFENYIASISEDYTALTEEVSQLSSEIAKSVGYKGTFHNNGITDCNNVIINGIYHVPDYTGISNLPPHKRYPDIPSVGLLVVMSDEISRLFQLFYSVEGVLYIRFYWDETWTSWDSIVSNIDFNNTIETLKETTIREFSKQIVDNSVLVSLNDCANNMIYRLNIPSGNTLPDNAPFKQGIVFTVGYNGDGVETKAQFAKSISGEKLYIRINWGDMWQEWQEFASLTQIKSEIKNAINSEIESNEQTVDFGFFEKFAVIGDSYASGEIYTSADNDKGYIAKDYYNLSWGQILARRYGNSCVNLSVGGLTTKTWLTSEHGLANMKENEAQQLYMCMLGHNDEGNSSYGESYLGSIEDITNYTSYEDYTDSFYGNYGRIIEQIKEHSPSAKIVLLSVAYLYNSLEDSYTLAIKEIAEHYRVPFINIKDDSFFASTSIYHSGKKWNHPTAPLYAGMANAIARLFNKCVIDNYEYFADYTG